VKLKVFKVRESAKLPVRAYPNDAGMDLFYCPKENYKDAVGRKEVRIGVGAGVLIPTGLKIGVPKGYMLEVKNKSGIAFKKRLIVGACVVDSGYDGEVFVNLNNIGTKVAVIEPGQKIAQAVLVPVETCGVEEIENDDVYGDSTDRGNGGFRSTGDF
jgi:dUTP pyrophosphatase